MTIPIIDPRVEAYLAGMIQETDPVVLEMEALACQENFPIVGPQMGRFLYLLARLQGARTVFEMGSGYAYSALWFARAVGPGGIVHCTDGRPENRDRAMTFLHRLGLADRVRFHVGDALELIEQVPGPFDVVFNDVNKEDYPATIEKALAALRPGGLFITDNVLWDGRVTDPATADAATRGVLAFNERITAHPGFETAIVPLRDGVCLARKK